MSLAIWPLAAQNVSLYPLAPGGIKCFIDLFGPWRHKILQTCDPFRVDFHNILTPEGSHVSCYLAPGGTKCFIIPFGPWRHNTTQIFI
jgi:hypothetical protein